MERRLCQWGAVVLLGIFFTLALGSAVVKSATMDEGGKLAMGYDYLKTFDLHFQKLHKHPRLAEAWAALPLLLDGRVPEPSDVPGWDDPSNYFAFVSNFYYRNPDIVRYTFVGRVQMILLGVLLGALVFRWASDWFGCRAGLLACFLYTFSPNVLANSRLITNDIALALVCLATLFLLQRLLRRPGFYRTAMMGLVLGSALLVKYAAVLLVPVVGMLLLVSAWCKNWRGAMWVGLGRRESVVRALGIGLLIFGLAVIIVWVGFCFEFRPSTRLSLPFPIPAASMVDDLFRLQQFSRGKPAFLLESRWVGGRWYYYFATSLFKTPPPALFLFVFALVLVVLKRRLAEQVFLWLFPTVYFLVNVFAGRNTGHRYLLPILPFGFVFVSQIVPLARDWLKIGWCRACGVLLAAWYLGASLVIFPDYLAYFNLFAGGPSRGYQVLLDSNLDWGQDLIQLRRYMDQKGLDEVWLSLFSLTDPALYGVRSRDLPNWKNKDIRPEFHYLDPDPGVYVISATLLHGLYMPNLSTFDWFLHQDPVDQIGHSMLVYRVEEDAKPPSWVGMCYAPDPPLSSDEIVAAFGRADLRVVHFDCRSSWVIPGDNGPGWYVVPSLRLEDSHLSTEWLRATTVQFEQRTYDGDGEFTVYEVDTPPADLFEPVSTVGVVPGDAQPGEEVERATSVPSPPELDGPAILLGYDVAAEAVEPGAVLAVSTFWRVNRTVTDALPVIFAHLVDADGKTWGVADALDFPAVQWQDGDILVQQHSFDLSPDTPPGAYWIAGGMYDLVTGARYPVRGDATGANMLLFGPMLVGRES